MEIRAIQITNDINESAQKPPIRILAGLHGNEIVGSEVILALSEYLLSHSLLDDDIRKIMDTFSLELVPLVNVDGGVAVTEQGNCQSELGKLNAQGRDLELDFGHEARNRQQETT